MDWGERKSLELVLSFTFACQNKLNMVPIILTEDHLPLRKKNFFDLAVADILRAIRGGSLTGGFILSFCTIDYLAWIESGNNPNKTGRSKSIGKKYKKWIEANLTTLNGNYSGNEDKIWAIRNS